MNVDPKQIIVTDSACVACGAGTLQVHHQSFPEMRIEGHSAQEAAERLASRLESALDVAVDPPHRRPLQQAIADVRAFLDRAAGMHPARDV